MNAAADKSGSGGMNATTLGSMTSGAGGGPSGVAGTSASSAPMIDDGAPTWTNIFTFELRSCRVSTCHGSGAAGIDMSSSEAALDSLIDQPANPARECAKLGKQRVVPGQPDESLLYLKLDINAPCGQQMPVGGQLSRKARDRIKAWIEMGAKRD